MTRRHGCRARPRRLFKRARPRLNFSPAEQRVRQYAVLDRTDADISASLGVSGDAIKKVWRRILERVAATAPDLVGDGPKSDGTRGKEKRSRIIAYVRPLARAAAVRSRYDIQMTIPPSWWARGLLFENCSCTLVCPGHMHFSQNCTYERCKGYWAIRIDAGRFGDVDLAGTRAVIAFDSPQRMIDGGWVETIVIDDAASAEQRRAVETILTGRAGGPWEKLGAFVGTWQPTEFRPIELVDEGATKKATIAGRLKTIVTQIRGRDKSKPVLFENIFNQIHAPTQVVALGDSEYDDGVVRFTNAGSHGLFSNFEWTVTASPSPAAM